MSESREKRSLHDLSNEELAGFVRLLLGGKKLPRETPDIIAYLESVARRTSDKRTPPDNTRRRDNTTTQTVFDRLREVCPRPIRPFGTHLLAKRTIASCRIDEVCRVLYEPPSLLHDLESHSLDPLDLEISTLAKISDVFGFTREELRESLVLESCEQFDRTTGGTAFARSSGKNFKREVLQIATEDLQRAVPHDKSKSRIGNDVLLRIEAVVQAVNVLLGK